MNRQNKVIGLIIILAISLSVFFFLIGGTLANIKFSEINTGTFIVPPPNNTSIQKAITSTVNQTSPTSSIQNVLDSAGCKDNNGICAASSPKFLINTQVILSDSNQQPYPYSTYVNIPLQNLLGLNQLSIYDKSGNFVDKISKLSLTDSQGHLLDLGNIKLSLYGVTNYDTNVVASGDFAVFLDDQLRGTKHLAIQGMTQNKTIPMQINGQPAYGFTFQDEGRNWIDGSQHIFKVLVGNVTATVGTGQNTQLFQYTKSAIAYVLVMTVNQNKITIIGVDNKAVAVFKADDTLQLCGRDGINTYQDTIDSNDIFHTSLAWSTPSVSTGLVSVSENGFLLVSGHSTTTGGTAGVKSCTTLTGIPRDTDIVINAGGINYDIHTPITQFGYVYDCSGTVKNTDPINGRGQNIISGGCTNNFGK